MSRRDRAPAPDPNAKSTRAPLRTPLAPHRLAWLAAPLPSWLASLAVFIATLAVYLRTLHTALPGPDAGEMISVARVLGIAHPPGYPLYILIAHLFGALVPWGAYAARINLLSALCSAAAAAVMCATVARLTGRAAAGIAAGLALGFARAFWRAALVAEPHPLNSLMASLLWLSFAALLDHARRSGARAGDRPPRPWPLAVMLLVTATIPAHHHTLLLLALPLDLAALAVAFAPEPALRRALPGATRPYTLRPVHALAALGLVLLGLAPLVRLPLAAAHGGPLVWGRPGTPSGFLALLTRAEYGSLDVAALSAGHRAAVHHAWVYLDSLPHGVGLVPVVLVVLGFATLVLAAVRGGGDRSGASAPRALLAALGGFALLQGLFLERIPLPADVPYLRGVVERFYPLPHLAIALLVGFGAARVLAWSPRAARRGAGAVAVGAALAIVVAVGPLTTRFRTLDQRGNTTLEDLARNVLASLPPRAVLFSTGDILYDGLTELTVVQGLRPDVVIADEYLMTRGWYVQALRRRHPELLPPFTALAEPDSDYYRADSLSENRRWIEHLAGVRPVAFAGFIDDSYGREYEMVRHGYTMVPYRRGQVPQVGACARDAARLLADFRLMSFFRPQDPEGAEAESRWRTTQMLASTCFLLCDPEGQKLTRAGYPGLARLGEFLERYTRMDPVPDPELLRAAGFLYVYHPEFRDRARAVEALERYLALAPVGPEADGVSRLLAAIKAGP